MARWLVPLRLYFVMDEGVIRLDLWIKRNRTIMPNQLRSIAERAERDNRLTVRVIPFEAGAHPGLIDPFTLFEFEAGLPDILFLDANRSAVMISGDDPRVAGYAEDFEELLEDALSAEESIESSCGAWRRICLSMIISVAISGMCRRGSRRCICDNDSLTGRALRLLTVVTCALSPR